MAGTMAEKWRKNGKVGAADRRSTNVISSKTGPDGKKPP